jgi:hypothetical protein
MSPRADEKDAQELGNGEFTFALARSGLSRAPNAHLRRRAARLAPRRVLERVEQGESLRTSRVYAF